MEGSSPADPVKSRVLRRRVVILLVFLGVIVALVYAFRAVLMPFLVAIFVAYLIDPLVNRLAPLRLFRRVHLGRTGAIICLYLVLGLAVYVAGRLAVPALGRQVREVRRDLPAGRAWLEEQAQILSQKWVEFTGENEPAQPPDTSAEDEQPAGRVPGLRQSRRLHLKGGGSLEGDVVFRSDEQIVLRLGERLQVVDRDTVDFEEHTEGVSPGSFDLRVLLRRGVNNVVGQIQALLDLALQFAFSLVRGVYIVVLIFMVTAFIVVDRARIVSFLHSVYPQHYRRMFEKLVSYIDRGLAGVIRGQLTICAVNGILTWVGLEFLQVPYAALLGLVAGIFSLIPIFGTIISTVPIFLIAWGKGDFQKGLLALGWIVFIHFIEANLLNPKIMGDASKIHPVVVIFALLAGHHAYGIVGALLAVPTASILQSSFRFYVIDRQAEIEAEATAEA